MSVPRSGSVSQDCGRERAERLYALALKARDDNLVEYALQLEQLAAEASAHAERLTGEFQEPTDQTPGGKPT
jgi:hypothetical protein